MLKIPSSYKTQNIYNTNVVRLWQIVFLCHRNKFWGGKVIIIIFKHYSVLKDLWMWSFVFSYSFACFTCWNF